MLFPTRNIVNSLINFTSLTATYISMTTCLSCVCRSPKSPNGSTFDGSASRAYLSCQEYSSTRTAVVRLSWLVRLSGTHWATTCMIQNSPSPALVAYWRCTCYSNIRRIERIRGTVR